MAYSMDFAPVIARIPDLVSGAINTVVLSAEAIAIGLTIGLCVALARFSGPAWCRFIGACYVEGFRNTPLLVQLFLIYFGLPYAGRGIAYAEQAWNIEGFVLDAIPFCSPFDSSKSAICDSPAYAGVKLNADQAAIFAVSLNLGAYSTEIFRAGLMAIPKTQIQAGLALGMSQIQVMRYVVLIPALRIVYPALTGQLTLTLLGTSIVSAISAKELTMAGATIESQSFRSLETFLVVAAIYICITFAFRFFYWLIGLWLFRRKTPTGSATAELMLNVQETRS